VTLTTGRFLESRWDLRHRLHCRGKLATIAAIREPAVIERILTHLGLQATALARADLQSAA